MSKFEIHVEVDQTEVRGGDTVTGIVKVRSEKDYNTKAITLSLGWYTHGFGNRDRGTAAEQTLHVGRIIADRPYEFPFSMRIPNGPLTFRGKLVNVDWQLTARADIAWKIDPKAERDLYLIGPAADGEYDSGPKSGGSALNREHQLRKGRWWWLLFILPFLAIGLGALYSGLTEFDPFLLIFSVPFVGLPLFALLFLMRNRFAEKRIGEVKLELPEQVRPGETFPIAIAFTPRASGHLNGIIVTLNGRERATAGSGTNRRSRTNDLHKDETEDPGATQQRLLPGKPLESKLELAIPADAAPSFYASDNVVQWRIKIRIDIPGWPDWVESRDVLVVPA